MKVPLANHGAAMPFPFQKFDSRFENQSFHLYFAPLALGG